MMKKYLSISAVVLCVAAHATSQVRDSTLNEIELAYISGQYLSAELEARRLLETSGLRDSVKVQLEKWIAFSLIAQGKSGAAKDRFIAIFHLDESFTLDPILTSPKILFVFNEARSAFAMRRRSDTLRTQQQSNGSMERRITYRTVLFPGWEQLHQGRTNAGYFFVSTGIISLTSGVVFEVLRSNARKEYLNATTLSEISSTYSTYDSYRKGEIYSFTAFAAVYLLSEADIFLNSGLSVEPTTARNGTQFLTFSLKF